MKFIKYIGLFLFFLPLNAYLQNAKKELLGIMQGWDSFKCINIGFTYSTLDANKDTFFLQNEGSLLFSHYRCKTYYQIAGINLKVNFTNKFIKNKKYDVKSDMENTIFYDLENSNAAIYLKINNPLELTCFKVNQLIPPLLLRDSSKLYNRRFLEKLLSNYDSVLTEIKYDSNYQKDFLKFEISFKNYDKNQKFTKWGKVFCRHFIDEFLNKKFIIIIDKKTQYPSEYFIIKNDTIFENYTNIKLRPVINYNKKLFSPYPMVPYPNIYSLCVISRTNNKKTDEGYSPKPYNFASNFSETDYFNNRKINLYDINSEYILLYFFNSLSYEKSSDFLELCKIANENPTKLSIIGMDNYDESKEYVEKVYTKDNWNFPMIKGRKIAKSYNIARTPSFVLIHKTDNYHISNTYISDTPYYFIYKFGYLRQNK